jgi:hypothetical protein
VLFFVARHQTPVGGNDSPPGKALTGGQNPPNRASSTRKPCLLCHLAVGGDSPGRKRGDDGSDSRSEVAHAVRMVPACRNAVPTWAEMPTPVSNSD